jgi:hypothetical protein
MSVETFDVLPLVVVLALVAFGAALTLMDRRYADYKSNWNEYKNR